LSFWISALTFSLRLGGCGGGGGGGVWAEDAPDVNTANASASVRAIFAGRA